MIRIYNQEYDNVYFKIWLIIRITIIKIMLFLTAFFIFILSEVDANHSIILLIAAKIIA